MFDTLNLTEFLALVFGLYFIAAGIGLISNRFDYQAMLDELYENAALGYISAILVFALGVVVVRLHNDWTSFMAGFVSFVGCAMVIEGLLLLAFRRQFLGVFVNLNFSERLVCFFGIGTAILGAGLIGLVCL